MCVAAFGQVVELKDKYAVVSFRGALKEVSTVLVPQIKRGDDVVVHAGFATEIVKDTQKLLRDVVATDAYARQLLDAIEMQSARLGGRQIKIMNFCGTHEYTISRYALRELLPPNIELLSGPGCPVCVTPEEEIAMGLEAARREDVILTTYGDLLKVPTRFGSLDQLRAEGANIKIIYDINQAISVAKSTDKEVVHFAVGFETTAPSTAALIKEVVDISNFSVLSAHRITPPAMEYVTANSKIDAVLCPGHVAMVIGTRPFDEVCRKYKMPCVISGFEPVDVLQAILQVLYELDKEEIHIINQYLRVVNDKGNTIAQNLIDEVFTLTDANWRGVGFLPKSRLVLKGKYSRFDAEKKFGIEPVNTQGTEKQTCICGEVLNGTKPQLCPNFRKSCTPDHPMGPCMVTREGTCCIAYMNSK